MGSSDTNPRTGTAGRAGDDVRSDCGVTVSLRDEGGVEVHLASKVALYYGTHLEAQAHEVLATLGVSHARVVITDAGALPFAVGARVEAAARAAGAAHGDGSPSERLVALRAGTPRDRLRRSRLYLPGNEPKFFVNAGLYHPDAVILDLEDSVHPQAKLDARVLVRNAIRTFDFGGAEVMVRINQLPTGLEDVAEVVRERPDLLLIPKVESAETVRAVATAVDDLVGPETPLWLMPILESALGIERALDIALASPRVVALTIGLEDYAADIGVPKSATGVESRWARERVVNAARAARIQPIDSVFGQVDDEAGLRRFAEGSRELGFVGMGCLHPRQIAPIHAVFSPTPGEIARARRIVEAYEVARAAGLGVVSLGAKMIDPPVVKQALHVVATARALGLLDEAATERPLQADPKGGGTP
jgi:citrate lyase subunit beta/citryl-CoA lyase